MAYSEEDKTEVINKICERVALGEALRNILMDEDMPNSRTFYRWIDNDEEKSKQYACACEDRQDMMFEDMLTIADDQEDDVYKDKDGNEHINHNVINRAKLRIDTRKWALSKLNPKKYGDKLQTENNTNVNHRISEMTDEEIEEAIRKEQEKHG